MSSTRDLFERGRFPSLYVYQTLADIVDTKISKCTTLPEGHVGDIVLYVGDELERGIYYYTDDDKWDLIMTGPEEWIEH